MCPWPGVGFLFALMILVWPAVAQSQEESLRIYTEHPRLFLGQHRLKLLQKEKERRSLRWQQFELLTAGHAPMPEPGLAGALYYRIAGDQASGRAAVTWALGTGTDLRQIALVFDWCQDLLSPVQSRAIAAKLAKGIEQTGRDRSISALRSRALAAELAMVPFDTNAPSSQILQGWLMHDNFLLRSTLGAPYEFLWANPYHPGLSYYLAPLVFHDENLGRLFIRSSWDESARWLGYFDGELQLFENGNVTVLNAQLAAEPMSLDTTVVFFGKNAKKFQTILNEDEEVFVLGLTPRRTYQVEVDDEEMIEGDTDTGGILELKLPHKV